MGEVHAVRDDRTTLCQIAIGSWWEMRTCDEADAQSRVTCQRCLVSMKSERPKSI